MAKWLPDHSGSRKRKKMKKYIICLAALLAVTGCTSSSPGDVNEEIDSEQGQEETGPIAYLHALPDDPSGREDIVIFRIGRIENMAVWDTFCETCRSGQPAEVTICTYTIEGDSIYTLVSYDTKTYTAVMDPSRDKFGKPEPYQWQRKYLIREEFEREEETGRGWKNVLYTGAYLSDDRREPQGEAFIDTGLSEEEVLLFQHSMIMDNDTEERK